MIEPVPSNFSKNLCTPTLEHSKFSFCSSFAMVGAFRPCEARAKRNVNFLLTATIDPHHNEQTSFLAWQVSTWTNLSKPHTNCFLRGNLVPMYVYVCVPPHTYTTHTPNFSYRPGTFPTDEIWLSGTLQRFHVKMWA